MTSLRQQIESKLRGLAGAGKTRVWLARLMVFVVAATVYLGGGLEFLERRYLDLRFDLLRRPATGDVVLVEIDPLSLQELETWPWPRSFHARLLGRLIDAGAAQVAFDIDFSSRSTPEADQAFETALSRASGRVILPVFMQKTQDPAELALNLPLSRFARHARLASVNFLPDPDGILRRSSVIVPWGESGLVSLAALLAERRAPAEGSFYMDFGIRLEQVPRFSYADVLAGRIGAAQLRGKRVIVGATAVELGEQIAVPAYSILPGPMVQVLAYETFVQDRALSRVAALPTLLVSLLLVLGLAGVFLRQSWRRATLLLLVGGIGCFGLSLAVQASFPLSLDIAAWQLCLLLLYLYGLGARIDRQDLSLLAQGLELRRKDAFMAEIVENSFDAIIVVDADGRVASFNEAATRIFGRKAELVIGEHARHLVAKQQDGALQARLAENFHLLRGGPYELLGQRGDGATFNMEVAASGMQQRAAPMSILHVRDITPQRQAEAGRKTAQRRLEEAIETMRDGFAMFDAKDRLVLCNKRFRDLHALAWQEPLEGRSYEDILRAYAAQDPRHPDRKAALAWVAERLGRHRSGRRTLEEELADGSFVRISQHRMQDAGSVCVYVDVTELRQRQQELVEAKEGAEAAKRSMSGFLANMSHELRTPLNAIIGFSTMMKDEIVGPLGDSVYKGYASDIHSSGTLLLDIINDVLDVSKIEAGKHSIEEEDLDLDALLESCLRLVRTRLEGAGLELTLRNEAEGSRLVADKRAVKQILLNLLSNAIKFTPDGGSVEVLLAIVPEGAPGAGELLLRVSDTGIGIAPEDIPRALAVFGQVDSGLVRRQQGTGLGLPLAERLTQLHGGSLTIESALGEGTTVEVRFPKERLRSESDSSQAGSSKSAAAGRRRPKRRAANEA